MIATGTPIGVLSGAILITDGINQISKEAINLSRISDSKSERYNCRSGDGNSNLHGIQTRVWTSRL